MRVCFSTEQHTCYSMQVQYELAQHPDISVLTILKSIFYKSFGVEIILEVKES